MTGTLVISLDFELMWGVRDHRTRADYGDAVLGVRQAIPEILARFKASGIHATWATVGLLFARNREEMLAFYPDIKPNYTNPTLSPLEAIRQEIGADETADPLHYGRSMVDLVLATPGQEVATHTYSHYYCLEAGQDVSAFEADLQASIQISTLAGARPTSIVFPRNQMTDDYVAACARQGIKAFRGNPQGYAYRARAQGGNSQWVRGLRLLDAWLPLAGVHSYGEAAPVAGIANVKASRFLRPYSPSLGPLNGLHMRRILGEMEHAARHGETYHLWCHPHNFGRHTAAQLARLDTLLAAYRRLADRFGMTSLTMAEHAEQALCPSP